MIGVEFASAWRSFGVEVTVVEALPRLVPNEEPEISKALERAFRKRKITALTGGRDGVRSSSTDDGVRVALAGGKSLASRDAAGGGRPRADRPTDLGYEEAGIQRDEWLRPRQRAARDLGAGRLRGRRRRRGLQLAHRGFAHGIFVAEEIAVRTGRLDGARRRPGPRYPEGHLL